MKFCKDCKYERYSQYYTGCSHPKSVYRTNLVTGTISYTPASYQRQQHLESRYCTGEALWFTPKLSVLQRILKIFKPAPTHK